MGISAYLWLETANFVFWVALMFVVKFLEDGAVYRAAHASLLVHVATLVGVISVASAIANKNRVLSWWVLIFVVGIFRDLEVLLEMCLVVPRGALWTPLLVHASYNLALSAGAFLWFLHAILESKRGLLMDAQ